MQFALAALQRLASDEQVARAQDERKESFHRRSRAGELVHATLTLTLRPLIWVRLSFEMMLLACSEATSTKRCRSRTSTVPTIFAGRPVSPRIAPTISPGPTPISAPTFMKRRVCSSGVRRLGLGFGAGEKGRDCGAAFAGACSPAAGAALPSSARRGMPFSVFRRGND